MEHKKRPYLCVVSIVPQKGEDTLNILIASNSFGCPFGYSRVFSPVARYLKSIGHNIVYFSMQMVHPPFKNEDSIQLCGLRYAPWGQDIFEDLLKMFKIDLVIVGHDIFLGEVQHEPDIAQKLKVPLIVHVTVNHDPLSPFCIPYIQKAAAAVVPSKFGLRVLREAGFVGSDVVLIEHGIDLNTFKPLPEEDKLEMRKRLKIESKSYVCLTTQRNKGGVKAYPRLFKGWKLVCENIPSFKEKSTLLMLADENEPEGIRLADLRNRMGLQNEIKFIWMKPDDKGEMSPTYEGDLEGAKHTANYGFSSEWMAKLYSVADVHIISSSAESFNLPCLESQACGVPQIFPDAHIGPELVGEPKSGLLIAIKDAETIPLLSDIFQIDPISLASYIKQLYEDEKLRGELGENALKNAQNYSWERILPRWGEIVERFSIPPISYQTGALGI